MSNVVSFARPAEVESIDASVMIAAPMAEVYAVSMRLGAESQSASQAIVRVVRFGARSLLSMVTGEAPGRPGALGLTPAAALRRACDLFDLADELEKNAESSADESACNGP